MHADHQAAQLGGQGGMDEEGKGKEERREQPTGEGHAAG